MPKQAPLGVNDPSHIAATHQQQPPPAASVPSSVMSQGPVAVGTGLTAYNHLRSQEQSSVAPKLVDHPGSVRYFQVEVFRKKTLCCFYTIFLVILICVGITVFYSADTQFECHQICNMGNDKGKCAINDAANVETDVATCLLSTPGSNDTHRLLSTTTVRSEGGVSDSFNSVLGIYPRFVVILGMRQVSDGAVEWDTADKYYSLNTDVPDAVKFYDKDGTKVGDNIDSDDLSAFVPSYPRFWGANASAISIIMLPRSIVGNFPDGTDSVELDFGASPLVTKRDDLSLAEEASAQEWEPIVGIRLLQRQKYYGRAEIFLRYFALVVSFGVLLWFINGWAQDHRGMVNTVRTVGFVAMVKLLATRGHHLPYPVKATVWYHLIVVLYADPLYLVTAFHPGSYFWYLWTTQILYNILVVATIFYVNYLFTSLTHIGEVHVSKYKLRNIIPSALLSLTVVVLELSALGNTVAASAKPAGMTSQTSVRAFVNFGITTAWVVWIFFYFNFNRSRQVWKKGTLLYQGTMRIFVLWLRTVTFCAATVLWLWMSLITAGIALESWAVPMYDLSGPYMIAFFLTFSLSALWLFYPIERNFETFPPNPNVVKRGALLAAAMQQSASQTPEIASLRRGPSQEPSVVAREPENNPYGNSVASNSRQAFEETFLAGSGAANSGYGTEEQANNPFQGEVNREWAAYQWDSRHFMTMQTHKLSGFFFETEEQKLKFDLMHYNVPGARSFFCWETAMSCLNIANEVYNRFDQNAGDMVFVEHQQGCCERCIVSCCLPDTSGTAAGTGCCGGGGGGNDEADFIAGVDHDEEYQSHQRLSPPGSRAPRQPANTDSAVVPEPPQSPSSAQPSPTAQTQAPGTAPLDTSIHGYTLHKVVVAHGVQALICYVGDRALPQSRTSTSPLRVPHVLIGFRGTCNAKNALTDVDFGRKIWSETAIPTNNTAKVHAGFAEAWAELKPLIGEHLSSLLGTTVPCNAMLIVTGHSLGGAVAALCTYSLLNGDLRGLSFGRQVCCYTFGMPRLGNKPFQLHYDQICPETYRIINENDKVAMVGHCGRKHIGREVAVDRDGNAVVEPNVMEDAFSILSGAGSALKNHLLDRYANSFDHAVGIEGLNKHDWFISFLHPKAAALPNQSESAVARDPYAGESTFRHGRPYDYGGDYHNDNPYSNGYNGGYIGSNPTSPLSPPAQYHETNGNGYPVVHQSSSREPSKDGSLPPSHLNRSTATQDYSHDFESIHTRASDTSITFRTEPPSVAPSVIPSALPPSVAPSHVNRGPIDSNRNHTSPDHASPHEDGDEME